jgi:Protein of unknown function (DUF4019)
MLRTIALLLILVVASAGCAVDTSPAEQAVPKFHSMLDAGNFAQIYDSSAEDLKSLSSQHDFVAFLEGVHRKLGASASSERQGWRVDYRATGTFITLTYKTRYAVGEAQEQFVFRMKDNRALLAGYHINSNALILGRDATTTI